MSYSQPPRTSWTAPVMECAFCFKKMKRLGAIGHGVPSLLEGPPAAAPLVCDKCGEINLMIRGRFCRKPSQEELEALAQSPIAHVLLELQLSIKKTKTVN